jgi:hypothetical protein
MRYAPVCTLSPQKFVSRALFVALFAKLVPLSNVLIKAESNSIVKLQLVKNKITNNYQSKY